jgi:hypothetical protein
MVQPAQMGLTTVRAGLEPTHKKNLKFPAPCEQTPSKCCVNRLSRQDFTGLGANYPSSWVLGASGSELTFAKRWKYKLAVELTL